MKFPDAAKGDVLHHRPHERGGQNRARVWKPDWAGDAFEILTQEELEELRVREVTLVDCDDEEEE